MPYVRLAKLLKSGRRRRGSKPQEQQTESTCAGGIRENPVQIPNQCWGGVRRWDYEKYDQRAGRLCAATRRAKILRANLLRYTEVQLALSEASPFQTCFQMHNREPSRL